MNELSRTQEQNRQAILRAEEALLTLPQLKMEAKHYFAEGLCARELLMKASDIEGSVAVYTGKIHLKDHLVVIPYGHVTVADNDGTKTFKGPCTFVGKAGSKRALMVHEDTLWIAIHASNATTQEEAEATLVSNDYEDFLKIQEKRKCLIS